MPRVCFALVGIVFGGVGRTLKRVQGVIGRSSDEVVGNHSCSYPHNDLEVSSP